MNDDPLHGFLVGLKLFAEMLANLTEVHPGCLAASFCYQDQLFNREIRELNAEGMLAWRRRFRERFDLIAKRYPPRQQVDLEALADMAATLVEGGLILGRALNDVTILPRQILLYRDFVRSMFARRLTDSPASFVSVSMSTEVATSMQVLVVGAGVVGLAIARAAALARP